jgi:hypothetical protein
VEDVKKLKLQVAVFGPGFCKQGDYVYEEAFRLGRFLADIGYIVMTDGNPEGATLAVTDGCLMNGGETLAICFSDQGDAMAKRGARVTIVRNLCQQLEYLTEAADAFVSFSPDLSGETLLRLLAANEKQRLRLRNKEQYTASDQQPVLLLHKYYGSIEERLRLFINVEHNFISPVRDSEAVVDYLQKFFQSHGK